MPLDALDRIQLCFMLIFKILDQLTRHGVIPTQMLSSVSSHSQNSFWSHMTEEKLFPFRVCIFRYVLPDISLHYCNVPRGEENSGM
jgi:hypothetical protein